VSKSGGNDEDVRSAAQMYSRYITFFATYAGREESSFLPDSAYFAAYESAKGYGDSFLHFTVGKLTVPEVEMVTQRYITALKIFPFDHALWPSMAGAIDKLGRSKDFLGLARPIAERVTRSRHVDSWVANEEPGYETVGTVRSALSEDLVLMYMGFASQSGMEELEESLTKLEQQRDGVQQKLGALTGESSGDETNPGPAARAPTERPLDTERQIAQTRMLLAKLERRIEARSRALPLYKASMETGELTEELRAQRKHPAHTLLRRMYYEKRS
jgi:hypothetical protein